MTLCACGQRPVDNRSNLGKTKKSAGKVSPPMPPLSKKDLSFYASDELSALVAALLDAQDVLVARIDYLEDELKLRGLIR